MAWLSLLHPRSLRATWRGGMTYLFGKKRERHVARWRLFYRLRLMVLLFSRHTASAAASRPRARLWVDAEAFVRIKKLLRRARHTIIIQMFIWKDDRLGREMAALLTLMADRGVRVYVSKEAVGDFFEMSGDFLATKTSSEAVWRRFWGHPNIRITHVTQRDHAKVFIIDDRILLLTGMNIADEYAGPWHDYLVELRGPAFVQQYLLRTELPPQPQR